MAKTYLELKQDMEALARQMEVARRQERAGVIARIREAIDVYEISADELFRPARAKRAANGRPATAPKERSPRYLSESGQGWTGRGPKPRWLKEALAAGKSLDDFKMDKQKSGGAPDAGSAPARGGVIRFRDGNGHAWSGFGPKPGWLKAALEAGKQLDEFAV